MDETPAEKRKEPKLPETPSSSVPKDPKDSKPQGRSRARSIWGRKKEK
jgi:hypothetical protein